MTGGLPATIDPIQLADQSARLQGEISLAQLPRLHELCTGKGSRLQIDLGFSRGELNLAEMAGSIAGELELICQRCLEPMVLPLMLTPRVHFLRSGDPQEISEALDTVNVDETINLYRLVEDEILLAVPMIPMHDTKECTAAKYISGNTKTGKKTDNPFAVLDQIRKK